MKRFVESVLLLHHKSVKIMSPTHPLSYVVILSVQLTVVKSECCHDIAISSSSTASSYQENQIGIYSIKPDLRVNDRPVYKQNKGNLFVYYWVMFEKIGQTFKSEFEDL